MYVMACFCSTKETIVKTQRVFVDVPSKDIAEAIAAISSLGGKIVSVKVTYTTVGKRVPRRRRSNKKWANFKLTIEGRRHCLRPFLN